MCQQRSCRCSRGSVEQTHRSCVWYAAQSQAAATPTSCTCSPAITAGQTESVHNRTSEVVFLVFLISKSRFTVFFCSFEHTADNLWRADGSPAATPHLLIFYYVCSVGGLESRYTGRLDFWSKLSEGQICKRISKVRQSQFPDIFTRPPQIPIFTLFLL